MADGDLPPMEEGDSEVSIRMSLRTFVNAPIDDVFSAYADPQLLPKWMGIRGITNLTGPLDRRGTSFTEVIFGRYRPRSEVLAAERPTLHVLTGRGVFGAGYLWITRFVADNARTEVLLDAAVVLPRNLAGWVIRRFLSPTAIERRMQRRLGTFARLAEARSAGHQ